MIIDSFFDKSNVFVVDNDNEEHSRTVSEPVDIDVFVERESERDEHGMGLVITDLRVDNNDDDELDCSTDTVDN